MSSIMDITAIARIFKNLCFFPVESVVLTLFLRLLMPAVQRAKLVYTREEGLRFSVKQIVALVCLLAVGVTSSVGYLTYRYSADGEGKSRSADYTDQQRVAANKEMTQLMLGNSNDWDSETVVCIVDSAYRGFWEQDTAYTVSVYTLDEEAFAAGQAADKDYTMDTLWGYSKSGPKNDKYKSLIKVATATFVKNEKSGEISSFNVAMVKAN